MKPLQKGDPCRVRLPTGEVVQAVYVCEDFSGDVRVKKSHVVELADGSHCTAGIFSPHRPDNIFIRERVRFVGPSCVLAPVEVSV